MTPFPEDQFADVPFHALVFHQEPAWKRTRESLLRFLNSLEGRRYADRSPGPIVVLASNPERGGPYYLHVTDGGLAALRRLGIQVSVFTSAFPHELPDGQIVQFRSA